MLLCANKKTRKTFVTHLYYKLYNKAAQQLNKGIRH